MKTCILVGTAVVALSAIVHAQQSKVYPLQPSNTDTLAREQIYHPEPIVFVHGVNDNDATWSAGAIPLLRPEFLRYDLPPLASILTGVFTNMHVAQTNYLHTFNYGDPPGTQSINRQSYEPIMWNAWEPDLHGTADTNYFRNPIIWGPLTNDTRTTLNMRIEEIRAAYAVNVGGVAVQPDTVVVAHSLGALVCHYYMLKNANDHGVRRLVTIAGAHQGSLLANWITWYQGSGGRTDLSFDGHKVAKGVRMMRKAAPANVEQNPLPGYFRYWNLGGIQNAMMTSTAGAKIYRLRNRLLEYFWNTPAPLTEYVFNAYQMSSDSKYVYLAAIVDEPGVDEVFGLGDGFVPARSAYGKDGTNLPSIWNGSNNINPNIHVIDPVLFGDWLNHDHTQAAEHTESLLKSLFGVPYRWKTNSVAPNFLNFVPYYARTYSENQSLSKYILHPAPGGGPVAYTDEPGIGALQLTFDRPAGQHALLIPAQNTWAVMNGVPQKITTNPTNFIGHQIIGQTSGGAYRYVATTGAKNRSEIPLRTATVGNTTNYWIDAGNEYLPASMRVQSGHGIAARPVLTNTNQFSTASLSVTNCLVQLQFNGAAQFQYGYFGSANALPVTNGTNNFVAAQAYNLAGFITPQVERAFDVPVVSSNVVAILRGINQREAMTTNCLAATEPTRWVARVDEWVNVNTNTLQFALNFFPTNFPSVATNNIVRDAWTGTPYADWVYVESNKTVVITNAATASSQFLVGYDPFLGTATGFTNVYSSSVTNFFVPAFQDDTLAGVPATMGLLG